MRCVYRVPQTELALSKPRFLALCHNKFTANVVFRCSVSLAEFDKDAAGATAESSSTAPSPAGSSRAVAPSQRRIVLLRNVFSESDAAASESATFYTELEEDMSTECGKCGPVLAVRALLRADSAHGTAASEFVEGTLRIVFGRPADAEKCVALMNGRRFDGRCLVARLAVDNSSDPPAIVSTTGPPTTSAVEHVQLDSAAQARNEIPTEAQNSSTAGRTDGEDALLNDFLSEVQGMAPP
eukprot:COSAG02_NODE_2136_length_9712_cov_5.842609_2_plen_240_part_00